MNTTTPDGPRHSSEIKSEITALNDTITEHARAGRGDTYGELVSKLNAAKQELSGAERRELSEAAEAHRIRQARRQSGMDTDGSLASAGYATPGDAIAANLRGGRVTTANLESLVREALSRAQDPR